MTWGLYVLDIQVCICSTEYLTSVLCTLTRTFQYSYNNVSAPSPGTSPGTAGHPLPSHRVICEPPPKGRGPQGRDSAPGLGGVQPVFGRDKTPLNILPLFRAFCLLLSWHTKKFLRGLRRRGKCKRESGDDRGEVCQSKWPSQSPGLLNGKYGMGAVPMCICWDELCKKLAGVPTITSYSSLSISPLCA